MNFGKLNESDEGLVGAAFVGLVAYVTAFLGIAGFAAISICHDRRVKKYIDEHYSKICEFIKRYKSDDPFLFGDEHTLNKLTDIDKSLSLFIKFCDKILHMPSPDQSKSLADWIDKLDSYFRGDDISFASGKQTDERFDDTMTYDQAGYFDAALVKKVFDLGDKAWTKFDRVASFFHELYDNFYNYKFSGKETDDSYTDKDFWKLIRNSNNEELKFVFWNDWQDPSSEVYPKLNESEVFENLKKILKYVKKEYEKMRKQEKTSE